MPQVNRSTLVPYSASAMYALVNDVEAYPQFLPWCRSAQVNRLGQDELEATIEMAKGSLRKSFTTRNRLQPDRSIDLQLIDGPFRRLEGRWTFEALDDAACKVSLQLDFDFASRLLAMTVGPVFGQIANSMVAAFSQRARTVYG